MFIPNLQDSLCSLPFQVASLTSEKEEVAFDICEVEGHINRDCQHFRPYLNAMMTNFNKCASNHILVKILLLLAQISISHALSSTPQLSRFRHATSLALVDPSAASILVQNLDPNVMTTVIPNGGFLGPFFSSGESSGWLSLLDAAKLPFLPEEVRTGLLKLPIAARIGLNIAAIDFIPTVIEVVFLRTLWSKFMATRQPYREIDISKLPISYDSVKIANFYKKMPKLVLLRVSEISALTSSFLISLLKDYQQTAEYRKSNERSRAAELTELLPKLGPAFVRIGQALSSRVDLCSPVYQEELSKLREEQLILTSDEVSNMIGKILLFKNGMPNRKYRSFSISIYHSPP